MNCIIPFESRVKFAGPIKEICSISLEHELTQNDSEVLGNFLISGTYKEHELSINTSDFKFTIPFNVELTTRIDSDSLEFSIDNFTYDIDGDEMIVKIDYIVSADDIREDIAEETLVEDPLELISEEKSKEEDIIELPVREEEDVVEMQIRQEEDDNTIEMEICEEKEEAEEERDKVNTEIVSALETENDYMTYHVHIVKESETIESIALTYKTTKDELEKFNDLTNLMQGDKIIIPLIDE